MINFSSSARRRDAEEEKRAIPGCGSDRDDFEPAILATSGPVASGDAYELVPLVFTTAGLEKLQSWLDGKSPDQGLILKSGNETKANALLLFHSADSPEPDNRPLMEIYPANRRPRL